MSIVVMLVGEIGGQVVWTSTRQDSPQGATSRNDLRLSHLNEMNGTGLQDDLIQWMERSIPYDREEARSRCAAIFALDALPNDPFRGRLITVPSMHVALVG